MEGKRREYLAATFNQLMVPYLGLQAIRKPDDENIQEQYLRLKVSLKENIIIMTRITTSMSLKT